MKVGKIILCVLTGLLLFTEEGIAKPASVASISPTDLVEYEQQPLGIRVLIENSLALTERKLTYQFGSNSPKNSGMDCSGAVQFTLKEMGMKDCPRSSYTMFQWAQKQGKLVETKNVTSIEDPVFAELKPGDLLFWEGTYETGKKSPPISHVMIYLGRLKEDGKGVMFGSSDGRRYRGKRITGVSVFDWKVPPKGAKSRFVGYASIPGLGLPSPGASTLAPSPVAEEEQKSLRALKSGLDKLFKKSEVSPQ